ncbi:hypothetical protein [Thalassoroseus pseudoceratinae]|uniref:hypothetical protein n=1 Tax=Thalassoroseus pseudoceratinae TaxID=2713176 RepID=UPI00141DDEE1|nr:hypothetical protein [Thalassoroseus pseudoceratinae]
MTLRSRKSRQITPLNIHQRTFSNPRRLGWLSLAVVLMTASGQSAFAQSNLGDLPSYKIESIRPNGVEAAQYQVTEERRDLLPSDPNKLKQITEILPFADYEPDPATRLDDRTKFQCPRPDGEECSDDETIRCPDEVQLADGPYQARNIAPSVFHWEASNIHYNPLYFEDVQLERYGQSHHDIFQPFFSAGKFGLQLVGLPYQATIDPVCKKIYPLGYYRPGDCAPKLIHQIPLNGRAAINQAAVTTGMFFAFP